MPGADVEQVLLAVAAGSGMALLPESVAERYAAPGVRFVPLGGGAPTFATAVVTRRDIEHMPTVAFLRELSTLVEAGERGLPRQARASAPGG
jgi:DNA-binding transcriptional LysR family regulator